MVEVLVLYYSSGGNTKSLANLIVRGNSSILGFNPQGASFNPGIVISGTVKAIYYPPANTLDDPSATVVHAVIASPILPPPIPFTNTVVDPVVIGA